MNSASRQRLDVTLIVNGRSESRSVPARLSLADFLRDALGLTGTHLGCEQGACGSCTVLVEGEPVRSCLMPVGQAQRRHVTTVEGLAPKGSRLSPLQQAFAETDALQCGFCTPGFLITATELVGREHLDEHEARRALSGNLCRCTGYEAIVDAVLLAHRRGADRRTPTERCPRQPVWTPWPAEPVSEGRVDGSLRAGHVTRRASIAVLLAAGAVTALLVKRGLAGKPSNDRRRARHD